MFSPRVIYVRPGTPQTRVWNKQRTFCWTATATRCMFSLRSLNHPAADQSRVPRPTRQREIDHAAIPHRLRPREIRPQQARLGDSYHEPRSGLGSTVGDNVVRAFGDLRGRDPAQLVRTARPGGRAHRATSQRECRDGEHGAAVVSPP